MQCAEAAVHTLISSNVILDQRTVWAVLQAFVGYRDYEPRNVASNDCAFLGSGATPAQIAAISGIRDPSDPRCRFEVIILDRCIFIIKCRLQQMQDHSTMWVLGRLTWPATCLGWMTLYISTPA